MARKLEVGDKIQLTGKFLRSTGQVAGGEGHKVWTVVAHPDCPMCVRGDWVAVDEPASCQDEVSPGAPPRPRHFNVANVFKKDTLDIRNAD